MASVNKCMLMGNLTRDPELRTLPNATPVNNFAIAMNRNWTSKAGEKQQETTFIECAAFGKQAEIIDRFVKKGDPIFVEGRLRLDTWEDKQTGAKRSKVSVVVEQFQLMSNPDRTPDSGRMNYDPPQQGTKTQKPVDDDIPF